MLRIFTSFAFLFIVSANVVGIEVRPKEADVLACGDICGSWIAKGQRQVPRGEKSISNLLIKHRTRQNDYSFSIEVFRGGSYTLIEGEFEMKNDLGLYSGISPYDKEKQCALVFIRRPSKRIEVTSFGECEEGHRAYPDGIYSKEQH